MEIQNARLSAGVKEAASYCASGAKDGEARYQVNLNVFRLDYISCVLTVLSTILIGRKFWQGWMIAGANSVIVCVIAARTAQFGFIPANVFCIALYSYNVWNWRSLRMQISK